MMFENMVARYRKISEHIEELKDVVTSLQGELSTLDAEIFTACMANRGKFNVYQRKTSSAGLVGREYFVMTFAKKVDRRGPTQRLDDQDWLATIDSRFVKQKLVFQSAAINAAVSSGEVSDGKLRDMGLRYVDTASLKVRRIPNGKELYQLREEAKALVEDE